MKILITGGCGFVGSNLAAEGMKRKYDISVLDNLSRNGSEENKRWLEEIGGFEFIKGDIQDETCINQLFSTNPPDVVFHLAGQVAMTTSIMDPRKDFEINALGTLNILEAIRLFSPKTAMFYSSTNKVYGDLNELSYTENDSRYLIKEFSSISEDLPLSFHSPYGCSKGAADQYCLDYHRIFGIQTVVFRHSSMYGGRQFSTIDQGWIGWFCDQALKVKEGEIADVFTISGNGKQVRDILHIEDVINLYFNSINHLDKICGEAFNIGGGYENSLSLIELFDFLQNHLGIEIKLNNLPPRESDQKVFIANLEKITRLNKWVPSVSKYDGLVSNLEWESSKNKI
jgi:CDP-paratose 2-epimerase